MTARLAAAMLVAAGLSACQGMPATGPDAGPPVPAPADDTCGAAPHAALVGQPETALLRQLIMGQVRVIRPGDAVTMDFRPERLNFDIGEDGRIRRIYCG